MNSLLVTTALLALGANNAPISQPTNLEMFNSIGYTEQSSEASVKLTAVSDFLTGDFMSIAKTVQSQPLYTGDGSALMISIRMHRF